MKTMSALWKFFTRLMKWTHIGFLAAGVGILLGFWDWIDFGTDVASVVGVFFGAGVLLANARLFISDSEQVRGGAGETYDIAMVAFFCFWAGIILVIPRASFYILARDHERRGEIHDAATLARTSGWEAGKDLGIMIWAGLIAGGGSMFFDTGASFWSWFGYGAAASVVAGMLLKFAVLAGGSLLFLWVAVIGAKKKGLD